MVNKRRKRARGSCRSLLLIAALAVAGWIGSGPLQAAQAQPQRKAATAAARRAANSPQGEAAKREKAPATPHKWGPVEAGRRDPFYIPPPPKAGPGGEGAPEGMGPLPPGKRGLVISALRVEGIVRQETSNTMIAVVATSANRAYFLRQNDEVYNGVVSKITPDSVYFSENYRDVNGRMSTRQVVKRLGSGSGENR